MPYIAGHEDQAPRQGDGRDSKVRLRETRSVLLQMRAYAPVLRSGLEVKWQYLKVRPRDSLDSMEEFFPVHGAQRAKGHLSDCDRRRELLSRRHRREPAEQIHGRTLLQRI